MSGIKIHAGGEPTFATDLRRPVLDASSNDVLIKVAATSVNPLEWKVAKGEFKIFGGYQPEVPGYDVAGTVVAVGSRVIRFKPGDKVWGDISPRSGSYAEYALADADHLDLKPEKLSFNEAGATPLAALTAYQGLVHYAKLKAGDNVLILGGSGGVGHFAIQIAKAYKANVWATGSSEHQEILKRAGADYPINYQSEDVVAKLGSLKMDIVFDVTGIKEHRDAAWSVVKKHTGHIITTQPLDPTDKASFLSNLMSGASFAWDRTASALWRDVNFHFMIKDPVRAHQDLPFIRQLAEEGKLRPYISEVYPLQRVREAWDKSKTMHPAGKIVLEVSKEQSAS
jgi:NADPH:quinone reductase-like Zn-dependent oxidoreductase